MDKFIENLRKYTDTNHFLDNNDGLQKMISECEQHYECELTEDDLETVSGGYVDSYHRVKQRVLTAIKEGRTSII